MRNMTGVTLVLAGLTCLGCRGKAGEEPAATVPVAEQLLQGRLAADWQNGPFVVLLAPPEGGPADVPGEPAVLDQFGVEFIPRVLVARVGQPVQFQNSEDIDHNVVAVAMSSGTTLFSASTPRGDPYTHTFDEAGGYSIGCDIHPGMTAVLVVVNEPHWAVVEPDGTFRLPGVPAGSYHMTVWNAEPDLRAGRTVTLGVGVTELNIP